jgi:hypothetical protein
LSTADKKNYSFAKRKKMRNLVSSQMSRIRKVEESYYMKRRVL